MTYNELLLQPEWFTKCRDVLQRDQYHCQNCGCLGYHDNSYYECRTAAELDQILRGLLIDGDSVSVFINKIRGLESRTITTINRKPIDDSYVVRMNNKLLYDFRCSRGGELGIWAPTRLFPIACDCIIKEDIFRGSRPWQNKHFSNTNTPPSDMANMSEVTCSCPIDWVFQYGEYSGYYIFERDYFKNYNIRIEKRWPTGVCGDQYGMMLFGHIIISVCYKNCCVALFFLDEAHLDNNGKYWDKPIIPKGLNVHHKYYVNGLKPWEYDNDALITLCQDCHMKEHQTKSTPVYRSLYSKQLHGYAQICNRCGGSGYLPQYSHVEGGVCFKCYGEGVFLEQE